jgi:hypothetical protein
VIAGPAPELGAFAAQGQERGVEVLEIGEAGGERLEVSAAEAEVSVSLADAERAWRSLRPG